MTIVSDLGALTMDVAAVKMVGGTLKGMRARPREHRRKAHATSKGYRMGSTVNAGRIKDGDWVRITGGKFKGWRGTAHRWNPYDKRALSFSASYKPTKSGRVNADAVGFSGVENVSRSHLKKI